MKKILLIIEFLFVVFTLSAQGSILIDAVHGSAYYVDPELANPVMIDFENVFLNYEVTVIDKDSISFQEILVNEYFTEAQNLEYVVDIPNYYPEDPHALYVIVRTGNIEELRAVTGVISSPEGEIVSELYNCQGHYDGASGDGWTININLLEQMNYEVVIGYGPVLYSSTAQNGKYDLEDFDAVIRIKDDTYYPIWGITQEFSEIDLTAISEGFDDDLAFLNVYNFHDPFVEKPFIHFRSEDPVKIDLELFFPGFLKLADPLPENRRGNILWNDLQIEPDDNNEIIYEGVLNNKLDFLHFEISEAKISCENLSEYPLNEIRLVSYLENGNYSYADLDLLPGKQKRDITDFKQYSSGELKEKIKSELYYEAIEHGLSPSESKHLIYDFFWVEMLMKQANENAEQYFGLYHFDTELYNRIIPCSLDPLPERMQRNMWVLLYNIQSGIDIEPMNLMPEESSKNSITFNYEMLEYGFAQEYYGKRGSVREDEFFGVELGEYILYWESGNVDFYNNPISEEISENIYDLELIEGYYTFNVEDQQEMGILYDIDYPQLPIAAALKVNENGRLIVLGTSYFFSDLYDHYQFLNNSLSALLQSTYFAGSQNNEIPFPLKSELNSYPNPFNPSTTITFTLSDTHENISLSIYNIKGQKVRSFDHLKSPSGSFCVTWDGRDDSGQQVTTGIYFLQLNYDGPVLIKKMLLLK